MKRIISMFLIIGTFAAVLLMPSSAMASGCAEVVGTTAAGVARPCPRGTFRVRRNTRTRKKLLNAAVSGGIGAAIGAGLGGKRGAALGAGSGAGGYLVYRYVRDRRGRCVRSYVR